MYRKEISTKLILLVIMLVFIASPLAALDIKKAGELYNAGKYSEAYSEFEKVYKKNQKDMAAFNGMAWSRFQQGKMSKAETMFKDILRREPFHAGAKAGVAAISAKKYEKFNVAWNKYYIGNFDGAVKAFKAIVKDNKRLLPKKEMWRVQLGLGYSYNGNKKYSDAKKHFKESIKLKDNYDAHKGIGLAEFNSKKYKPAIKAFNASLKLNPVQYDVSTLIAWSYLRNKDLDNAVKSFRKQLSINAYVADVHYGLGLALDGKGNKKAARDQFYSVVALLPGHLISDEFFATIKGKEEYKLLYRDLGWALYYAGFSKGSLDVFERGLKFDSGNAALLRGAGYAALKIKDQSKAIKYSKKSISKDANLPPVFETSYSQAGLPFRFYSNAQTTLAWAYFFNKDYAKASKEFKNVLKVRPDWPDANSGLGWVYYSQKKYADAEEQFSKAVKLDSTYYDAHSGLAAVNSAKMGRSGEGWKFYYMGQYKKAVDTFSEIARKKKLSKEAAISIERGLGWSNLRLGKNNAAEKHFKKLIKKNSSDSDAILGMGFVLYEKEDYAAARDKLKKALKAFPLDINAEIALGWSYFKIGNFTDSLVEFRRAIQLSPNLAEPHRGVGFALTKLGRNDEGKVSLVRAINLFPQVVDNDEFAKLIQENKKLNDLYITLSWSFYNFGQFNEALRNAKKIGTDYADLNMLFGYIYYGSKQYDNAIKSLEKYAARSGATEKGFGKYSQTLVNLGWSYYNKKDYNAAYKNFERLSKLHKKDDVWAVPYDGMGWSLMKSGDKSMARKMFEKSLKRAPGYPSSVTGMDELKKK